MTQHRHVIIYLAPNEGSRIKPFELFHGNHTGYRRAQHCGYVEDPAYQITFYTIKDGHEVAHDFEELGVKILRHTCDGEMMSELAVDETGMYEPREEEDQDVVAE